MQSIRLWLSLWQIRAFNRESFTFKVAVTLLAQFLTLGLSILNLAVSARLLGPEGRGVFTLAILLPNMLGTLFNGGISSSNAYFSASKKIDIASLLVNSFFFSALVTIICGCVFIILIVSGILNKFVPGVSSVIAIIPFALLPIGLVSGYLTGLLQGLQLVVKMSRVNLIQGACNLLLTIFFVAFLKLGVLGAIAALIVSSLTSLGLILKALHKEVTKCPLRISSSVIRRSLSYGLRSHIGDMLQFFNYRLDTLIINYYIGQYDVGIYSVSVRLAELLWMLPNSVGMIIFPKAAGSNPSEMNKFTPKVFQITLMVSICGAILLAIFGTYILQIFFSERFQSAYPPMLVLLPGVVLLGAGKILTNEIAGRGYPHYNSINAGLALIITLLFDFILIPRLGIFGAAMASSIAYSGIFITSVSFYIIVRGYKDTPIDKVGMAS